ncbi:MAG: DEAD/DEAH box helicase, partial [Pseudonocardia sp.]|nr:DEAD/DEAH box helicase [Pseudonocardia sp.]
EFARTRSARAVLIDGAELPDGDLSDVVTVPGWDHQRRAVAFTETARALLLAIPMGGGKTAATIAGLNRVQAATVLIVCPNQVRAVWPRETREKSAISWHCEDGTRPPHRAGGRRQDLSAGDRLERMQRVLWGCDCGAPVHAFCINYEALATPVWRKWQPPHPVDAIVYDEIHRLKSPTGAVSKVAAKWHGYARRHIGLSGTPLPQTPLDAFGVMRALDPGIFGTTWTGFKNRYAVMDPTGTFPITGRIQNGGELARKFMSITYRPEIDLKLPPVLDVARTAVLEPAARKVFDDIAAEFWADLTPFVDARRARGMTEEQARADVMAEIISTADGPPSEITAPNVMTRLLRQQQLTGGFLADDEGVVRIVSTAKRAAVAAWLADEVVLRRDSGDPVVLFCRFHPDLDVAKALAAEFGVRYGEISGRAKTGLDSDARMHPDVDLVGVQIQSGGTGIDLTRARYGGWYSLGYSVSDYDQARKRLDRPGQTRPVTFAHFVVEDTADQAVYDAIDNRRAVISEVLREGEVDPASLGVSEPAPPRPEVARGSGSVRLPWD